MSIECPWNFVNCPVKSPERCKDCSKMLSAPFTADLTIDAEIEKRYRKIKVNGTEQPHRETVEIKITP